MLCELELSSLSSDFINAQPRRLTLTCIISRLFVEIRDLPDDRSSQETDLFGGGSVHAGTRPCLFLRRVSPSAKPMRRQAAIYSLLFWHGMNPERLAAWRLPDDGSHSFLMTEACREDIYCGLHWRFESLTRQILVDLVDFWQSHREQACEVSRTLESRSVVVEDIFHSSTFAFSVSERRMLYYAWRCDDP